MQVAVIGSGIVGLATAYSLAVRGAGVTILANRPPGAGASSNNAGWVVPSMAGPVPAPGVVLQTLRWMARRDSPVYVRPAASPSFVRFMTGMLRACNEASYAASFDATARLARGTLDTLDAWAADGIEWEGHAEGQVLAYLDPDELRRAVDDLPRTHRAGLSAHVMSGDEARALVPDLADAVTGAIRFPEDRHLQPQSLVDGLATRLRALGVEPVEGTVTAAWALPSGGVELRGDFGSRRADALVIAAGAWTARVARLLGVSLPIRPGKGYSLDYVPAQLGGRIPVMLSEAHVTVTPFEGATRVSGTMEFGGLDERVSRVRLRAVREAPLRYLRSWDPGGPSRTPSAGLRPMTPDGIAVIGRLAPYGSVYVASGHAMLGVTLAPRTGALLADLILDGREAEELLPFSPARFGA
jgi:D-amino-acid dehydrogenase